MNLLINFKDGLYVCEITRLLGVPQYNVSKHLTILKMADLVEEEKQGKMVLYRANFVRENLSLFESIATLVENEEVFQDDLGGLDTVLPERGRVC